MKGGLNAGRWLSDNVRIAVAVNLASPLAATVDEQVDV